MKTNLSYDRTLLATAIAGFFHIVGLVGMLFFDRFFFASLTPFNLLLSFALLVWVQEARSLRFFVFIVSCYVVGFFVEYLGVNYQLLFGSYQYVSMGLAVKQVPLIIGVNWFIIVYCCGATALYLLDFAANKKWIATSRRSSGFKVVFFLFTGGLMATAFDWLMEPVAVHLNYWKWLPDGSIPMYNYVCWFGVSVLLLVLFKVLSLDQPNRFARHLLLIQTLFFFILRMAI